jgi:hypothetical protein
MFVKIAKNATVLMVIGWFANMDKGGAEDQRYLT